MTEKRRSVGGLAVDLSETFLLSWAVGLDGDFLPFRGKNLHQYLTAFDLALSHICDMASISHNTNEKVSIMSTFCF